MMTTCPICEQGNLEPAQADRSYEFKAGTINASLPASRCTACGEELVAGPDIEEAERQVANALVAHGVKGGDVFRFVRKVAGLPAKDVARLLGVDAATISRWENGDREIPRASMAMLGVIVLDELRGADTARKILEALDAEPQAERFSFDLKLDRKRTISSESARLDKISKELSNIAKKV